MTFLSRQRFIYLLLLTMQGLRCCTASSLFGSGAASLGSQCSLPGASCPTSTECALCAVTPLQSMSLDDEIVQTCSGDSHILLLLINGTAFGAGPVELLGVTPSDSSLSSSSSSLCIGLSSGSRLQRIAENVSNVSCVGNMSLLTLQNQSALFFGQAPSIGVARANSTFVYTPTLLTTLLLGDTHQSGMSQVVVTVQECGLGLDSIVCVLINGSVLTTGTGSLSGTTTPNSFVASWWRVLQPAPCGDAATGVAQLTVGAQHALILCRNGSVVGFGDNSFGQLLGDLNMFTVEFPTILLLPALNSGDVKSAYAVFYAAAGFSHSLLLAYHHSNDNNITTGDNSGVQQHSIVLFGAGDNSQGALGFTDSAPTTTGGIVYGFRSIPLPPAFTTTKNVSGGVVAFAVIAGRQLSALMVKPSALGVSAQLLRTSSNVYVTGSNQMCALGGTSLVSSGGVVSQWAVLPIKRGRRYNVSHVNLAFSRRLLAVAEEQPTLTTTVDLVSHSSSARTRTVQSFPVVEQQPSVSLSWSKMTSTASINRGRRSVSEVLTMSNGVASRSSLMSHCACNVDPGATAVTWEAIERLLVVRFNVNTNTPSMRVDLLFSISALVVCKPLQSVLRPSTGCRVVKVQLKSRCRPVNITISVAVLGIRTDGGVVLLSEGGQSLPAVGGSSSAITVTAAVILSSEVVSSQFGPPSIVVKVAAGVGGSLLGCFVIAVLAAFCLRHRRHLHSVSSSSSFPSVEHIQEVACPAAHSPLSNGMEVTIKSNTPYSIPPTAQANSPWSMTTGARSPIISVFGSRRSPLSPKL
ncbi:membrane-associated protein, putative [Bodo saltans]|uniref:Membrane-associated protein, putative n=1 Tax=Bodo saltans TaxID=75058 RepID=A0A0S4JCJ6_BODSA|nr:membrane-associated protein, putative [Bodo saltans]|eukprot:CUG87222.1 membrane-associated protein, putative [Bodo saltans]